MDEVFDLFPGSGGGLVPKGGLVPPWTLAQGNFGICYLYDAIQSLSRLTLLRVPGHSATGVYKVTVYDVHYKKWTPIYVDDRVPAKTYTTPMGGWGDSHTVAISVLVKTIAKILGGYDKIEAGSAKYEFFIPVLVCCSLSLSSLTKCECLTSIGRRHDFHIT